MSNVKSFANKDRRKPKVFYGMFVDVEVKRSLSYIVKTIGNEEFLKKNI